MPPDPKVEMFIRTRLKQLRVTYHFMFGYSTSYVIQFRDIFILNKAIFQSETVYEYSTITQRISTFDNIIYQSINKIPNQFAFTASKTYKYSTE